MNAENLPWLSPLLREWSIVGMHHYRIGGTRCLFVAMVKDGRCITMEGIDCQAFWKAVEAQAQAADYANVISNASIEALNELSLEPGEIRYTDDDVPLLPLPVRCGNYACSKPLLVERNGRAMCPICARSYGNIGLMKQAWYEQRAAEMIRELERKQS